MMNYFIRSNSFQTNNPNIHKYKQSCNIFGNRGNHSPLLHHRNHTFNVLSRKKPRIIFLASTTTLFLYSLSHISSSPYLCCEAFANASYSNNSNLIQSNRQNPSTTLTQRLFCTTSQGENMMDHQNKKSTQELQSQWAGGRDVWKDVPININLMSTNHKNSIHIQTKIKEEQEKDDRRENSNNNKSDSTWPDVVTSSILYGFGAYNPRGQTLPDDVNRQQHLLLEHDIQQGLEKLSSSTMNQNNTNTNDRSNSNSAQWWWWQGASIWEDGSSERGFIVAFSKQLNDDQLHNGHNLIIELATKYNQGGVYRFEYDNGKLMRHTVAVLDTGTDASVEVIMDDVSVDLSIFE